MTPKKLRSGWKRVLIVFIIVLAAIVGWNTISPLFRGSSDDITAKHVDSSTPFVEDQAKILSEATDQKIAAFNERLEAEHDGAQLLVVTVPSLDGEEISTFAAEKGKQYGIGDKDKDNGLVYVISVDDHSDFIATGYGMEDKITDVAATEITDNAGSHAKYKSGDYDAGVLIILDRIQARLDGEDLSSAPGGSLDTDARSGSEQGSESSSAGLDDNDWTFIIIGIIFFGIPGTSFMIDWGSYRRHGRWPTHHGRGDGSSYSGIGFSSSGGGSSGGSWGGSGGGGSFGGGGGGSSW
jgi:uncharacterized protein